MTKKRIVFKLLGRARKSWLHFRSGSEEPRILRAVSKDEATEPENALRLEIPPFRRGAAEDIGLVAGGDKESRRFGLDRSFPLAASMLYYAPPRNRTGGTRKGNFTSRPRCASGHVAARPRKQGGSTMTMRPDPTFHASPKLAMEAPPENFAYTLLLSPDFSKPDALAVVDVKPGSPTFSQVVHTVTMPHRGDEFHHFGWNACSSALSPLTGHAFLERRYLIIPGLRSSRIYVVDAKPDPTKAKIHKIIEPEEIFKKTGYSRPHTVHCGPEGIYVSTLGGGGKDGTVGPPGIFIMDCETFDILGRWEIDRGPQNLHYDFWWNLPRDYMVTSEWALPPQFENGIVPEDLLSNKYGHRIHFWDLRARRNVQTIDLGANHQMALEVRPAHDPVREYGFLGVVVDTTNLEGSIWTWWREGGKFHIEKTATIPPEAAPKEQLPPLLQGFGAVPPLVTDIDLSMDDKFLS